MFDEDDFKDRPKMKESRRDSPLNPKLCGMVRDYVLTYTLFGFVSHQNVAYRLQAEPHHVRMCMAKLSKEGILSSRKKILPSDKLNIPNFMGEDIVWSNGKWRKRDFIYKYDLRKTIEVISPTKWDGTVYFILRDSEEYKRARLQRGLSENPWKYPWECSCGTNNESIDHVRFCRSCHGDRKNCELKMVKPERICKRCNAMIKSRHNHSREECNINIVNSTLNE